MIAVFYNFQVTLTRQAAEDLLEFVRRSKESLGGKSYKIATKAKDASMFANATGYSVEQLLGGVESGSAESEPPSTGDSEAVNA